MVASPKPSAPRAKLPPGPHGYRHELVAGVHIFAVDPDAARFEAIYTPAGVASAWALIGPRDRTVLVFNTSFFKAGKPGWLAGDVVQNRRLLRNGLTGVGWPHVINRSLFGMRTDGRLVILKGKQVYNKFDRASGAEVNGELPNHRYAHPRPFYDYPPLRPTQYLGRKYRPWQFLWAFTAVGKLPATRDDLYRAGLWGQYMDERPRVVLSVGHAPGDPARQMLYIAYGTGTPDKFAAILSAHPYRCKGAVFMDGGTSTKIVGLRRGRVELSVNADPGKRVAALLKIRLP